MTLLKDLPIEARIREAKSNTVFLVADHQHMGWTGTTLVADKVCMISCIDAAETSNPDETQAKGGCNRYSLSNIHQWLNSDRADWFQPTHPYDAPPTEDLIASRQDVFQSKLFDQEGAFLPPYAYAGLPGYLTRFSKGFKDALLESGIPCFGPSDPGIIHYGPPVAEDVFCKVFLLSAAEVGLENEVRFEGYLVRLFQNPVMRMCTPENAALWRDEKFVYQQSAVAFWLRSPQGGTADKAKIYQAEHKFGDVVGETLMPHPVNYAAGIRPAMNLDDHAPVGRRDEDGIYTFDFGGDE